MRAKRIIGVIILIFLIGIACFFAVKRTHASSYTWAGKWKSDWGRITLHVQGNSVTGRYGHKNGTLTGTTSYGGRVLSGKWRQAPSYNPPKDAGVYVFKMSPDGRSFSGTWWYGYDPRKHPNGSWRGRR